MRIDMGFDGLEFQRLYQGLQLEVVQLVLSRLSDIMIDEINTVPDEKINEGRENIAADFLGNVPFRLFLVFKPRKHAQIGLPDAHGCSEYD
jgi:hypothetical protein